MAQAAADRVRLSYVTESSFGDETITAQDVDDVRFTSENLSHNTEHAVSAELGQNRQVEEALLTDIGTTGDINLEMSYGAFDDFLLAALQCASWSAPVVVGPAVTISFAAAGAGVQVISDSGSGFGSIVVNQWVQVSGAASALNNGLWKVTVAAAGSITVVNPTGVLEAAAASITVTMGGQIVNGVTCPSFAIEKHFRDITTYYEQFFGQSVNTMNLAITSKQIVTGSFGFMGRLAQTASTSISNGGSYTAAPTNQVFNAAEDVYSVFEGGAAQDVVEASVALGNNLRARSQVGTLGPLSLGSGTLNLTGTLKAYLTTSSLMDKYLGWTSSSLGIKCADTDGNALVIDVPKVRYTAGKTLATGQNADVLVDLNWLALRHATEDAMIRIVRWAA